MLLGVRLLKKDVAGAAPVSARMAIVKPAEAVVVQLSGWSLAGINVLATNRLLNSTGLKTICSEVPGRARRQPMWLLADVPPVQVVLPRQQTADWLTVRYPLTSPLLPVTDEMVCVTSSLVATVG